MNYRNIKKLDILIRCEENENICFRDCNFFSTTDVLGESAGCKLYVENLKYSHKTDERKYFRCEKCLKNFNHKELENEN